jgi:hypothetical protein
LKRRDYVDRTYVECGHHRADQAADPRFGQRDRSVVEERTRGGRVLPGFLEKVVSALAAVGGAVWVIREGRRLDLAYQIKMSETLLDSDSEDARRHFGLLSSAASGEPHLIPPQSGGGDEQAIGNPTRFAAGACALAFATIRWKGWSRFFSGRTPSR